MESVSLMFIFGCTPCATGVHPKKNEINRSMRDTVTLELLHYIYNFNNRCGNVTDL